MLIRLQVKIGIPVAVIVIIAAVVGGVVGSKSSSKDSSSSSSTSGNNGNNDGGSTDVPSGGELSSIKDAVGRFATSTNSFGIPIYPTTASLGMCCAWLLF